MLDVKITGYVVPVAEQPQASLTPVISVENVADEAAVITGLIRIYRESTGLMIYSSELAVTQLEHHSTTNIAALTPFDPPAPADDDYFVKADIIATSFLPGPPITNSLGAWHFDIKTPPMGEAPAGHAVTHELGGSDPVDVTGLDGNPDPHAASHAEGESDELSHGDLEGLADDDHPQYRLRHELFVDSDFLQSNSYHYLSCDPWVITNISGGSNFGTTGTPSHPGISRCLSSTSAGSGSFYRILPAAILIAGGETSKCWHRPQTLALTTRHHGFHNVSTVTDPADGAWIWQDPATGIIYGRTKNVAGGSTTGTGFQLVTNTWYCEKIIINADATLVDFYCYAEDGTELWHDSLTTNIPTAAGDELGHGVVAHNSGTTAVTLDDIDYLSILIPDRRPNV